MPSQVTRLHFSLEASQAALYATGSLFGMTEVDAEDPTAKALQDFALQSATSEEPPSVPDELQSVLVELRKAGVPYYAWSQLRELLVAQTVAVIDSYQTSVGYTAPGTDFARRKEGIVQALRSFDAAPFTVQRLAELLLGPKEQV
jgi:PPP4R2